MNFKIRMGIPEMDELWRDLQQKYRLGTIKENGAYDRIVLSELE